MIQSIAVHVFLQQTVPNTGFFNFIISVSVFIALTLILFYVGNIIIRQIIDRSSYLIKLLLLSGAVLVSSLLIGWASINMNYLMIILGITIAIILLVSQSARFSRII